MRIRSLPFGVVIATLVFSGTAHADRVSGHLTRTFVIVEDTDLVGDVTCDVGNNTACFSFGAANVELRLNGFTITGRGDAVTGCGGAAAVGEAGIITSNMPGVVVRGPGLIQRFRGDGITVGGSRDARIEGLTLSTNCMSGVRILATSFGTLVQGNVSVRNGSSNPGLLCGGIWVIGHNSRVRLNSAIGNGYSEPADDFGIGLIGTPSGNVIEQNSVSGNTNGIYIAAGAVDNVVRENIVVGNPGIQSANTSPNARALDIVNLAPVGQTRFERNVCVTSLNAPCPVLTPPQQEWR